MGVEGKVVLVTGASQGIGKATAEAFLAAGARVALCARRIEPLAAIAEGREEALAVACDVSDPASVDALFAAVLARFGRLDVAFNNAGAMAAGVEIGDMDWETWRRVLSVNLDGAFLVARGAFRAMRDQRPQGGRIINNGSISAHAPRPGSAAYTASKHAITGLTKTIALDGRRHAIACGQIDIGNAATEMISAAAQGALQPDGRVVPEPLMDVAHVADAVVTMAGLPLDANIPFLTIMATNMPWLGRG
ncbi:MAG: SDR family oxidoreductase [Rhodobacteraceae bacterium]|nr:MAG: SDR family oxidoreductase [Paracoccaceae bacterium]